MSEFALVPGEMRAASAAAESAASDARGADGSRAMSTLAAALPGSTTAEIVDDLARAWDTGVSEWADGVEEFGRLVDDLTADATGTDTGIEGIFGGLLGSTGQP